MKLNFKILFLFFITIQVLAKSHDIIVIYYDDNKTESLFTRDVLVKYLNIPKSFIVIEKKDDPCEVNYSSLLHICYEGKNDMKIAHIKHDVIQKSFAVFLKKE